MLFWGSLLYGGEKPSKRDVELLRGISLKRSVIREKVRVTGLIV